MTSIATEIAITSVTAVNVPREAISITVASAEGPAISGTASGTMNGSPPGASAVNGPSPGKIIRSAIRKSTMPPEMLMVSWSTLRSRRR